MTKKQLWESKLAQRGKHLKEAYDDFASAVMSDGTKVYASASTRSTRTYNYEDVEFEFGARKGRGTYRWMNRPWQRFIFADALKNAMIDAGVDKEFARECIDKSGSLRSAVEYFAKNYKIDKKEIEESKKQDAKKNFYGEEKENKLKVGSFEFCVMDKYGNNIDCFEVEEDAIMFAKKKSNADRVLLVKYGPEDEYKDRPELSAETIWSVNDNEDDDEIVKEEVEEKKHQFKVNDRVICKLHLRGHLAGTIKRIFENSAEVKLDYNNKIIPVNISDLELLDKESFVKEEVEENKTYQIKYWLTEEDREEGFSDIFIDSFDSKQKAIMTAKKMVDRGDVASVEVFDAEDVTEQPVYFYDGNEENIKEEKGAKIASIIASALNKQGGHGPMGNEEVVADENTITLVSQAGLETYKFNNDGSVDNLSIDDMIKTMLEDGDIEEGEIEDIREEYSHFNSIKDLLQSNLTWFMELPEKLIIKKVEEILDEEKDLEEARGPGKGQKLDKFFRLVGNLYKDNLSKEEIAKLEKAKSEVERFEPTSEYEKKDKKNLLQQIERALKDGKLEEAIMFD